MADTSKLKLVTNYILGCLNNDFKTKFKKTKLRIGTSEVYKEFSGVSTDGDTIIQICHHSGKTTGGSIPVGKLNGLFSKCYLLEKVDAQEKYIYFTNKEFYELFYKKSKGIIDGIELRVFEDLPLEYEEILNDVLYGASKEMSK